MKLIVYLNPVMHGMIHCELHVSSRLISLRIYERLQTLTLSPLARGLIRCEPI